MPTGPAYTAATGATVYAGRYAVTAPAPSPSASALDLIAAAPANSWVNLSAGRYDAVWPTADNMPLYAGGPANDSKILLAWSSVAWNDAAREIVLYGGGHANTNSNSAYRWRMSDRSWQLAYYPSDIIVVNGKEQTPNGPLSAPVSAHTFATNTYLPRLNRFFTLGGAAQPGGNPYEVYDGTGARTRYVGGYTLDMAQAGTGKLGGPTGTNPKRGTTAGYSRPGASAWGARDWGLDHPTANLNNFSDRINGWAQVVDQNSRDVLYFTAGSDGQTTHGAWRVEFVDNDYRNDIITQVGAGGAQRSSQGALHVARNLMISLGTATSPLQVWDLASAGPTNSAGQVPAAGISGTGKTALIAALGSWSQGSGGPAGMAYDERRQTVVLWLLSGEVLELTPPASGAFFGWVCTLIAAAGPPSLSPGQPGAANPYTAEFLRSEIHICGKFRRAPYLDVCLAVTDTMAGEVWAYKPASWVDPRI